MTSRDAFSSVSTGIEAILKVEVKDEKKEPGSSEYDVDVQEADIKKECSQMRYENVQGERIVKDSDQTESMDEAVYPEYSGGEHSFMMDEEDIYDSETTMGDKTKKKEFPCNVCEKPFSSKANLQCHERIHSREMPYSCHICGKLFIRQSCHNLHLRRFHSEYRPHSCGQCGKGFLQKYELVRHERVHSGETPYSCTECGKAFKHKMNLKSHYEGTHLKKRPFECRQCGKTYVVKSELIKHENSHHEENLYRCQVCNKTFTQKSNLTTHEKLHSGVRPFQCKDCPKTFFRKANLLEHAKIHSEIRSFGCGECGIVFMRERSLIKHLKKKTLCLERQRVRAENLKDNSDDD